MTESSKQTTIDIWPETQALGEGLRRLREEHDEAIALLREVAVDRLPRNAMSNAEAARKMLNWQTRAAALVRRASRRPTETSGPDA